MFGFTPKGMADVEVQTGKSAFFIVVGVAVFGGSHWMGACCAMTFGGGPSG